MADIKTTMDVINQILNSQRKDQVIFDAIQQAADRRRDFENSQIELAEQLTKKTRETDKQVKSSKKLEVNAKFTQFQNLNPNEISIVMGEEKAKLVIRNNSIDIAPKDLGLKPNSKGWKLLQRTSVRDGELSDSLKKINTTSDLEKEKGKIKAMICRLRSALKDSLGLIDNPIIYTEGGYRFTFKLMKDEVIHGNKVTKGADAMNYTDKNGFDENKHGQGFWQEDE